MAEKCFRKIDKKTQKEILLDPKKRKMYVEKDLRRY